MYWLYVMIVPKYCWGSPFQGQRHRGIASSRVVGSVSGHPGPQLQPPRAMCHANQLGCPERLLQLCTLGWQLSQKHREQNSKITINLQYISIYIFYTFIIFITFRHPVSTTFSPLPRAVPDRKRSQEAKNEKTDLKQIFKFFRSAWKKLPISFGTKNKTSRDVQNPAAIPNTGEPWG